MVIRRCTESSSSPSLRKPRTGRPDETLEEQPVAPVFKATAGIRLRKCFQPGSFFTGRTTQLCPNTTRLRAVQGIGNNPLLRRSPRWKGDQDAARRSYHRCPARIFRHRVDVAQSFRRAYSDRITERSPRKFSGFPVACTPIGNGVHDSFDGARRNTEECKVSSRSSGWTFSTSISGF